MSNPIPPAAPSDAERENPLDHFMRNIDGRTTLEVFESMCSAMKNADACTVSGDQIRRETWYNIFKCEAMRLAREYEEAPNVRRALTAEKEIDVEDVKAWADGVAGALGTEYGSRVKEEEARVATAILAALKEAE